MNANPLLRFTRGGLSLAACLLSLTGCGRYADFTLPPTPGGMPPPPFQFVANSDPVLSRDSFSDALNPSVAGRVNLYSVYDGHAWHTALATTSDGAHWEPQGVVLRAAAGDYIAANGSALLHDGQFWYWYETGSRNNLRISLARSVDARSWTKESAPVLGPGPPASWDERGVADPYVIRIEPYFYMYYLGQDRAVRQRLGVARSRDGIHWEKLRANPILELEPDQAGLGEPAVWQSQGFYWMLYTVREFNENRHLRLARSIDGVHWTTLPAVYRGTQAWNSKVICDPTVVVDGNKVLVWFGGGDVASPDENLHGQIGFATLAK
jgi:sucrose-6-phosphate hydrolase SacC (GH32 family)